MCHVKSTPLYRRATLSFLCLLLVSGSAFALGEENIDMDFGLEQESLVQMEPSYEDLRQAEISFYENEGKEIEFVEGLEVKPKAQGQRLSVLGELYEQRLLYDAQAEVAKAQSKIQLTDMETATVKETSAPVVRMVQGVGKNLYATFLYPGNMTVDARVGDMISGGYTVKGISVNQVTLEKDGETIYLRFSATPSTPNQPRQANYDQMSYEPTMLNSQGF